MMPFPTGARLAVALVLSAPVSLSAQRPAADSIRLDEVVVTASRTGLAVRLRAAAADRLDPAELARRSITRLEQALRLIPSTSVTLTGTPGGVASSFLRGVNSNQTLLLIDGIRVNDANAFAGSLLGGLELAPDDRLEVVRGPQSTLYGGAAIGGVIAIGAGEPPTEDRWRAGIDAGSFGTWRGRLSGSLVRGGLSVTGHASFVDTENQRPHNAYDQRSERLRIAYRASERLLVGATFRGAQQSYTSPGNLRTSNTTPVGRTTFENHLGTAFADLRLGERWSTRLTTGVQDYFLRGSSRFNGGEPFISLLETTRWVVDWQHRVEPASGVEIAAGVNGEWATVTDNDGARDERLKAGYAEVSLQPTPNLGLTAGLRDDSYSTFGSAVTGRVGLAWFVPSLSARVRGTWGTGFMPPGLAARFGGAFQRANPDIRPERSTGWDLGLDLYVAGARGVIGLTAFRNDLRDLIGFESAAFPALGRAINIARARTQGFEATVRLELGPTDLRASYAYLDAKDRSQTDPALARLIRRPRHAVGADVFWAALGSLDLGAGFTAALDREDTDFNVFPSVRVDPGNYLDARVQGAVQVRRDARVRIVVENLFNERYEEVYGFPSLGRRVTVGLEVGRF